jgi:hypothetical protein
MKESPRVMTGEGLELSRELDPSPIIHCWDANEPSPSRGEGAIMRAEFALATEPGP